MMFSSLLKPENIILELESSEKDVLFAEMVENIVTTHPSVNRSEALAALTERENKMNTCIKSGIAVPHASCASVTYPVVSIGIGAVLTMRWKAARLLIQRNRLFILLL